MFLCDSDQQPLTLWHGTCAEFDCFYPLSQFAVDKNISDCHEFYKGVRCPPIERFQKDDLKWNLDNTLYMFKTGKFLDSKTRHPNFKMIPVHLKMENPLVISCYGFDLAPSLSGLVWGVLYHKGKVSLGQHEISNAVCDFIFQNPYQLSPDEVKKELALGHLYSPTDTDEKNSYNLTAQRFIRFLETMGYDGVLYTDYMRAAVDAWKKGQIKDFDQRAYVIFHPDQVIRLDKKIDVPNKRPNHSEKIQLNKIWYQYQHQYCPHKISFEDKFSRLEYTSCIKKCLRSR